MGSATALRAQSASAPHVIFAHFVLPEEETSDTGVHALPPRSAGQGGSDPTLIPSRVLTTPLSKLRNIYQPGWIHDASEVDLTFAERVFPGAWGLGPARSWSKATVFRDLLVERVFGG